VPPALRRRRARRSADTVRFACHLAAAYAAMWVLAQRAKPPQPLVASPIPKAGE